MINIFQSILQIEHEREIHWTLMLEGIKAGAPASTLEIVLELTSACYGEGALCIHS